MPNRVFSQSAPVSAPDRRSQIDKNTIKNTWLNVGQSQGIQRLFSPYTNSSITIHIVPLMSNCPDAFERPRKYHGSERPPRK